MDACHLCENACTNSDLTSDIDLSFHSLGRSMQDFRIMFVTGGGRPTVIEFETWKADEWHRVGLYCPRFCPNCGRKLVENEKKKDC